MSSDKNEDANKDANGRANEHPDERAWARANAPLDDRDAEHDGNLEMIPQRLQELIVLALQPVAQTKLDAMVAATIRERILKRVRASKSLTTIQPGEGEWAPFSSKVSIKVLRRDVDTQSYLLRLEPGAVVLPHVHGQDEECMVLEGEVRIGDLLVTSGAYHLAPRGVPHEPISSEHGALLFLRGAIPAARQVRWGRAAMHALTGR